MHRAEGKGFISVDANAARGMSRALVCRLAPSRQIGLLPAWLLCWSCCGDLLFTAVLRLQSLCYCSLLFLFQWENGKWHYQKGVLSLSLFLSLSFSHSLSVSFFLCTSLDFWNRYRKKGIFLNWCTDCLRQAGEYNETLSFVWCRIKRKHAIESCLLAGSNLPLKFYSTDSKSTGLPLLVDSAASKAISCQACRVQDSE